MPCWPSALHPGSTVRAGRGCQTKSRRAYRQGASAKNHQKTCRHPRLDFAIHQAQFPGPNPCRRSPSDTPLVPVSRDSEETPTLEVRTGWPHPATGEFPGPSTNSPVTVNTMDWAHKHSERQHPPSPTGQSWESEPSGPQESMHEAPPNCPPIRAGCWASVFRQPQQPAALSESAFGSHSHDGDLNKVNSS